MELIQAMLAMPDTGKETDMTPNPTIIARTVSTTRIKARVSAIETQRDRDRQRRANGYRGPLTRADLARQWAYRQQPRTAR